MSINHAPMQAYSDVVYTPFLKTVPCRVAVDIGANNGGYTNTMLQHGFVVHAFEPVPRMFAKLVEAHGKNPKAMLNNLGLSDRPGVVKDVTVLEAWTIGRPGDGDLRVSPDFTAEPPFDMRLTTLDSYLDGRLVGIIKLDVDGYEFNVLKGARRTIKSCRPPILCELSCYIEKVGCSSFQFCKQVFDLGYYFASLDGNYVAKSWREIGPYWPNHTSYDIVLIPEETPVESLNALDT